MNEEEQEVKGFKNRRQSSSGWQKSSRRSARPRSMVRLVIDDDDGEAKIDVNGSMV
jgi:hypothetical protein